MSEFKRYRDAAGSEFSSAVSAELAEKKGWVDVTSDENPAVGKDGKPRRAMQPAPAPAAKTTPKSSPTTPTVKES